MKTVFVLKKKKINNVKITSITAINHVTESHPKMRNEILCKYEKIWFARLFMLFIYYNIDSSGWFFLLNRRQENINTIETAGLTR